ncbi:hypothetical protein [Dyella telluris]|uniref:Uncharacterized protein n=1 Tax=Dyella telluris TaxID=2763498 RepID=A0A7G8Q4M1_9GAMM|nr:hypothetical protein [Dyella telluris]QNK01729.1 hypothetical protein H8F01_00670 [Dyella telluris]
MRRLIIALIATLAVTNVAAKPDRDYCTSIARFMQFVAKERDEGVPKFEMLDRLNKQNSGTEKDQVAYDHLANLVDVVYKNPDASATQTADIYFDWCMKPEAKEAKTTKNK